jgi:hypothetical protein
MTSEKVGDRIAIVTGGAGGIGHVVAERLATDGMTVVVHYTDASGPQPRKSSPRSSTPAAPPSPFRRTPPPTRPRSQRCSTVRIRPGKRSISSRPSPPLERLGTAADIAEAVAFPCRPRPMGQRADSLREWRHHLMAETVVVDRASNGPGGSATASEPPSISASVSPSCRRQGALDHHG